MEQTEQATRPKRARRLRNGRLELVKRPDAAGNATPRKVSIIAGGQGGLRSTALLRDPLDLRTAVGKAYHAQKAELRAHVGGDPSLPQEKLIDQAARLAVLADIAWGALIREGSIVKGTALHPAFEAYLRATRDQRDVLRLLGIQRHAKQITLPDLLAGRANLPEHENAE